MKKDVNFRLFKVVNKSLTGNENTLIAKLSESLADGKKMVDSRIMPLKEQEPSDKDVLGACAKTKEYIYGIMMRIACAKDVPELPDDFSKLENIDVNKIIEDANKKESSKMVCKSMYHVLISGDYVVTDLPKSRPISCFQDYVNWLLILPDTMQFSINPVIDTGKIQLKRLKSVVFKDAFEPMPQEKKSGVKRAVDSFLNAIIEGDDISMKKLHEKRIVSARLTVDFDKPRKMTVDDYEKTMSAILKTANKPENVNFVMNDKKELTGNDLLYSRTIKLENEPVLKDNDYIHAMKGIINDYEAESKK